MADSGASVHMTSNLEGMVNLSDCVEEVTIGNGQSIKSTKIGDKKATIQTEDGL